MRFTRPPLRGGVQKAQRPMTNHWRQYARCLGADPEIFYPPTESDDGVLAASFALPDFGPGAAFPGSQAIGFHFVDYVVHGWDVARTIDAPFTLPADVISAVLRLVFAVPDGDFRTAPGSPFAPAMDAGDGVSDLDRALLHLGRTPGWTPPR